MKENNKRKNLKGKSLFHYYGFTKKDEKRYPVVSSILKQLTPERIELEIKKIQEVKLPPELQKWVGEYEEVGDRDEFIWKWTYIGMKRITLPVVAKKYRKSVIIAKFLSIVLNVLCDDLADKKKEKKMLEVAFNICFPPHCFKINFDSLKLSKEDKNYLKLIKKIWFSLNSIIKIYPKHKILKDVFMYDYRQFLNTIRYSYLINKNPYFINLTESEVYFHHNMHGMISITLDLMCSLQSGIRELNVFREIGWRLQQMGRIGNLITTWDKEIYDNDFTSDVFAYLLKNKNIKTEDLFRRDKKNLIEKIKSTNAENYFLRQWDNYYSETYYLGKDLKSTKINDILKGAKEFLIMHLVSRGKEI